MPKKNKVKVKLKRTKKGVKESEKKTEERTKELEDSRKALMNILEDVEYAKNQAEEEKDKTLSMVRSLSDGIIVFDNKGKIFLINPPTEKFLSLSSVELMGKTIEDLEKIDKISPLIRILGREIKGIFRKEIIIQKKSTLEVSTVPMVILGVESGSIVILHDITREKRIESMKTEFVSLAAHQLRTPLAAIKWTIKMLLDGDLGEMNQGQKEIIQKAYQSNERMITLINDLLNVTRIEEGRYLYNPVLADLKDIADSVIKSHEDEIKRRKIKLKFKKSKDKIPMVMMDVEKIGLVVQNILENAIKYTPSEGEINVFLDANKKEIELSIKDTGVGIPKDQQARIFTKFFRGANVIRMETEGSGLGTFISKNIVDAHGGKIWFESEEQKGTTFHFSLPIKKEFEGFLKEF